MNFAKFLRTPFLQSTSGQLLLEEASCHSFRGINCMRKTVVTFAALSKNEYNVLKLPKRFIKDLAC